MSGAFEALSGAKGLRTQGESAKNIAEFNAQVAEQEGKASVARAGFDQIQQANEAERIKSSLRAGIGGAGGGASRVGEQIIGKQAEESELENLLIGFEGETAKQRAGIRATGQRLQGKAAKQSAKSAARRANVGFGMQLGSLAMPFLTGFGGGGMTPKAGGGSLFSSQAGRAQAGFSTRNFASSSFR